ncbi:MAG: isocitrate lyase/phosphoenolpyruvate mutase family protein [Planctomycetota bacterium]|nr:isocitrate lyase/phosphoenolpyruvate mutase family protein [Planctomycetota bacterium]
MSEPTLAARLRRSVEDATIQVVGVPNALAAVMAEREGFDGIYLSGAALSSAVMAVVGAGLYSPAELVQQAAYIARSVDTPLMVDADMGFGDANDVRQTVVELEAVGAAAIEFGDQRLPKHCGHLEGRELVTTGEMSAKLRTAVEARRNPDLIVIGRTDARGVEGFDAAIRRAGDYLNAGADWIFPESLQTKDEFAQFATAIDAPLVANMTEFGKSPSLPLEELADMGYACVLYPVTLLRVAMKAVEAALAVLADEGSQLSLLDLMQTREELYDLLGDTP